MARKRFTMSDMLNDLTFKTLYNKYKLIAMTSFKWEGLPDGITERHIERELFSKGKAIFFRDPNMSYMCLAAQDGRGLNHYSDPLSYRAVGLNYNKVYDADDCVIIENNILRLPTEPFIYFYVNKLTESERTMDVNVKSCKTPVVVMCDDKTVLSFKSLFSQVDGNVPAIYADKNLNLDAIQALDLKTKFLGKELMDYKKAVEGELLTFLGKNNSPVEKRERTVVDEVNANNDLIASFFDLQKEARERAAEQIRELYGLKKVRVTPRQEVVEKVMENVEKSGGADNERHD